MTEPPINRSWDDLDPDFRARLWETLQELSLAGHAWKFHEGFRTVVRQQWLYGQGRPSAPYGRRGIKVTQRDGVKRLSNHQGTGQPGTGRAGDCYPVDEHGHILLVAPDSTWRLYAETAERHGLVAGFRWKMKDSPHVELPVPIKKES